MSDSQYTHELQDVLDYMIDILVDEFPTKIFTPEYLMVSILDIKNCHANMILDNCLMSDNINELKEAYISVLQNHIDTNVDLSNKNKVEFNFELDKILERAEDEMKKTKANEIGTEHVLLSILNPNNNIKIRDVFNTVGISYDFILDKCMETKAKKKIPSKPIKPINFLKNNSSQNDNQNLIYSPKSQIDTASIISKDEFITKYTININDAVENGKVDELIGRETEISSIIKVLSRRKKNNVVLVGNGGVGKTAIVYGLASMIENGKAPANLSGKKIVMIDIASIVSGTHFRGMFEERVKGLFDELKESKKYILFIDDIQNVLKTNGKDKDGDISGMIGDILTEGDVRVIGTTTFKDYRNSIESNSSLSRKFQKIIIEAPNESESIKILNQSKKNYEDFHNVTYTDEAIEKAVTLAERYITDRSLPDSAFDIIDLAGASAVLNVKEPQKIINLKNRLSSISNEKNQALNSGEFEKIDAITLEENEINKQITEYKRSVANNGNKRTVIDENDIAKTVSEMTNIPATSLSFDEKKKLAHIDSILKETVIGQDEAIDAVCKVIKRNRVGLGNKNRPIGVFLWIGKSGEGKTYLAKQLAKEVFNDEKALVRLDMSEYSEKSSVSKLTGSAPGYIGYENGGQLTEAIKNKQHCVLLLDEIEKADDDVYNVFLQLFDDGRLTDSAGQTINFKNVIVVMTSNVGAKQASEIGAGVGFSKNEETNSKTIIEKAVKNKFTPEFLNRIDKIICFNTLTDDNLNTIIKLEINKLNNRLKDIKHSVYCTQYAIDYIHSNISKEKDFGARPILREIQNDIEDPITDLLLENKYSDNYEFTATCENNRFIVK